MKYLLVSLFAVAALSAAPGPGPQSFTGVITDDMCAGVGHAVMRMGPTDEECAQMCVMTHDAAYVLDGGKGKTVYVLSDQTKAAAFVTKKVKVVGTLDAKTKTIHVQSITAAK